MGLARFMASTAGRAVRIIAGLALIVAGLWLVGGTAGIILAAVGVFFVLVGVFNVCVLAPLFGGPLNGRDISSPA